MINFSKLEELYQHRHDKELLKKHSGLIRKEELITDEEIRKLRNYPKSFIAKLLERIRRDIPDAYKRRFLVEKICAKCDKREVFRLSREEFLHYLTRSQYVCHKCLQEEKLRQIEQATKRFIENYLDPNKVWKPIKRSKFYLMMEDMYEADEHQIANYIKEMDYSDFLQTPYWIAIKERLLKTIGYKCQLCGDKKNPLHIHHNTYEHHGYEHIYYREDLIVLCERCHLLFHELRILKEKEDNYE